MDILSVAAVRLSCSWCRESYEIPLRNILLSHEFTHEDCLVAYETECPPVFKSRLASEASIKAFEQAWRRLERAAAGNGGKLVLIGRSMVRTGKDKEADRHSNLVRPGKPRRRAA